MSFFVQKGAAAVDGRVAACVGEQRHAALRTRGACV